MGSQWVRASWRTRRSPEHSHNHHLKLAGAPEAGAELLVWLGEVVEASDLTGSLSSDALDIPVFRSKQRARLIHPTWKEAISRSAAEPGACEKTGPQVIKAIQKHKRFAVQGRARAATSFDSSTAGSYLKKVQELCRREPPSTASIAADATRFSGKDHFWASLWFPAAGVGCWGPPQATKNEEPRDHFRTREGGFQNV